MLHESINAQFQRRLNWRAEQSGFDRITLGIGIHARVSGKEADLKDI